MGTAAMPDLLLTLLLVPSVWLVLFIVAPWAVAHGGQRRPPGRLPVIGSLAALAAAHSERFWAALRPQELVLERRSLEQGLRAPLLRGAAFSGAILLVSLAAHLPVRPAWILGPPVFLALSEWTAGVVRLHGLALFERRNLFDRRNIVELASRRSRH